MPTKDSGKPTSRRPAGAGKKTTTPAPASRSGAGKRTPPGSETPSQRAPGRRASRPAAAETPGGTPAISPEPEIEQPAASAPTDTTQAAVDQVPPEEEAAVAAPEGAVDEREQELADVVPERDEGAEAAPGDEPMRRRERRGAGTNALGVFIERQFASPTSPAHSYSDLERHSGISREALSRYVTARADRRRSPTIDTLVAIADALHVSLEAVARAAGASVKGVIPPPEDVQHAREEALGALVAALSDQQFSAVVELLRQLRPPVGE